MGRLQEMFPIAPRVVRDLGVGQEARAVLLRLVHHRRAQQVAVEMTVDGAEQTTREVVDLEVGDEPLYLVGIEHLAVVRTQRPLERHGGLEGRNIRRGAAGAKVADLCQWQLALFVETEEQFAGANPDFNMQRVEGLDVVDARGSARRARRGGLPLDQDDLGGAEFRGAPRAAAAPGPGADDGNT